MSKKIMKRVNRLVNNNRKLDAATLNIERAMFASTIR